ncbi:hypothetical protein V6N13_075308 [Hibiscus sabdariffa]
MFCSLVCLPCLCSYIEHPDRTEECRKMCLHAVNSLSEAPKVVSGSELPVFFLDDDVGCSTDSRSFPCVQILNRVESEISVVLTEDLLEDG